MRYGESFPWATEQSGNFAMERDLLKGQKSGT